MVGARFRTMRGGTISPALLSLLVLVCSLCIALPARASESSWSLAIREIGTVEKLHTIQHQIGYDGTVTEVPYDNQPSAGNCYALVSLAFAKNNPAASEMNLNDLRLNTGDDTSYEPVRPAYSFLQNHNYSTFPSDAVTGDKSGFVAFEVPSSLLGASGEGWSLSCGDITSPAFTSFDDEAPVEDGYVKSQQTLESDLIARYKAQGGATLDDPFVVQNLYGNAPLTAVALFETESDASISVTVNGKDSSGDLTYEVEGTSTYHEVPIYGLYADYDNTVDIVASNGQSTTLTVTTDALPEDMPDVARTAGGADAQQAGQLYLLQSPYQIAFDVNGDIRWYLTKEWSTPDCSYSFSFDNVGNGFWASRNPSTGSVYNWGCEVFHMRWTGRVDVLHSGAQDTSVHHAGTVLGNGNYLYFAGNRIYELDADTGAASPWFDFDTAFDPSIGSIGVEGGGSTTDPWHTNSIQYLPEDESIIVSLRNQNMILKLDIATKAVKWVLTPASGGSADGTTWTRLDCNAQQVMLPEAGDNSFEWFYEQHDSNVISYDAETGILRLALFDNGTYRYNYGDYPNNLKYSRMVVYELNEQTGVVKQVFQYGKERGTQLYSPWYGSARYIEANDHYVGCFRKFNGTVNSHIVETDADGSVVAEYQVDDTSYGVYRAYPVTLSKVGSLRLAETEGVERHEYSPNYWQQDSVADGANSATVKLTTLSRDGSRLSVMGSVDIEKSSASISNMKLVAEGTLGTYKFNLINAYAADGRFYGKGIDISSLPDDTYTLSVEVRAADGVTGIASLNRSLTVGEGAQQDIEITNTTPDDSQEKVLESLLAQASSHGLDDAYVSQDPFGTSPLTAAVCFSTDTLSSVSVRVHGKTEDADIAYDIDGTRTLHVISVWGLYYNDTTHVTLTVRSATGETQTKELDLTTGEAPNLSKMPKITATYDEADLPQMAEGLTFCATIGSYHLAVDKYGDVRWYYSEPNGLGDSGITFNDQQHLLVLTPKSASAATNSYSMMEMDLLGRVYKEYFIDGSFHHEVKLMGNGHILCAASRQDKKTINDYIVELDPETGEVVRSWNIDEMLAKYGIDTKADPVWGYASLTDEDGKEYNANWFHDNCIFYNDEEDSFILSSRHRSMVIKISAATGEVKWVLGDHELLEDTGLALYLLTPVDSDGAELSNDEFEWQYGQHAPTILSNGDLLLFDNGDHRSRTSEGAVEPADNYSRMVQFHIDEQSKTVSQVWQFGKELGNEHYCTYVGDADELGENHYLGTFGGHMVDDEGNPIDQFNGSNLATLFETVGDRVIWQLDLTPTAPMRMAGIYRSHRVNLTKMAYSYDNLSGVTWLGNTSGSKGRDDADPSSFGVARTGITVESIKNEGNRITLAGTTDKATEISEVYVALNDVTGMRVYDATLDDDGNVSCSFVRASSESARNAALYLLVVRADGTKVRERIAYDLESVSAFSVALSGDQGSSATLSPGNTYQLHATLSPSGVDDGVLEFSSSDSAVASVDQNGLVTAKLPGTAIVTARARSGGVSAQMVITVTGISIERQALTLRRGDEYALDARALFAEDDGKGLAWASNDQGVVTVDEKTGLLKAIDRGIAVVRAQSNGKTVSCEVTVQPRIDEGIYAITSALPGSPALDIAAGSRDSGANLQIWTANHSAAQQFAFTYVGNGEYVISPQCSSGKALDVRWGENANGANAWQYDANGSNAQKWYLQDAGNGTFNFVSVATGKYLDVFAAGAWNGNNVQLWQGNGSNAQRFRVDQLFTDGVYTIEPVHARGKVLDIVAGARGDGANLQIWDSNGSDAQKFLVRNEGNGSYSIASLVSGKMLDVAGAGQFDGCNVQQWSPNGSSAQRWTLKYESDGTFSIVSHGNGRYLDVLAAGTSNGTNVQTWAGNGSNAQRFRLKKASKAYVLESAIDANYVVDIPAASKADGVQAQLYAKNGTSAQLFEVSGVNPAHLFNKASSKSLDVRAAGTSNGTAVQQYRFNGTASQDWYLEYAGNGYYRVVARGSGKCLDVPAGIARNGAQLQLWERNDSEAQLFKLVKIGE